MIILVCFLGQTLAQETMEHHTLTKSRMNNIYIQQYNITPACVSYVRGTPIDTIFPCTHWFGSSSYILDVVGIFQKKREDKKKQEK